MDADYARAVNHYKLILKRLKKRNTDLVDQITAKHKILPTTSHLCPTKLPHLKSILPFISRNPSAGFLVITPLNLFTRDDPILRYLPTIRTAAPAYISWYEGTVIGERPYESRDTIERLFLTMCDASLSNKIKFIRLARGRNPLPAYPSDGSESNNMEKSFCGVCSLFGCGIHQYGTSGIAKYSEITDCECKNNVTTKYINQNEIHKWINESKLKTCVKNEVIHKYLQKYNNKSINEDITNKICNKNKTTLIPIKEARLRRTESNNKEFYMPCRHKGTCTRETCECFRKGISCEMACGCASCGNMNYCKCEECSTDCRCYIANRECTGLCICAKNSKCKNKNILRANQKRVAVFPSPKHGYGLYSEEFIKKGEFVIEYTGELISDKEAERRGNFYELNKCSYLFNLVNNGDECLYSLDAFFTGNQSKYINHSKANANLKATVMVRAGLTKIVFYALKDIYRGEELLFDYQFSASHMLKHGIVD